MEEEAAETAPTDFDLSGGINEGDTIVVVFLDARCYGENVGIEDYVIRVEVQFVH